MEYNVKTGLGKIWRWKWWILVASVVAGALSIYLSFEMDDEFKSEAAFVPPSYSALGTMTFGNGIAYNGFYAADEEDIDRTVDYLSSREVTDKLAASYDLWAHYGIDSAAPNSYKKFYAAFEAKNVISYDANSVVTVECWDNDPKTALQLANAYLEEASAYFDRISQRRIGLAATERALADLDAERRSILDSLSSLRTKYGIYHLDNAGEEVSKILAQQLRNEPKFSEYYDEVKTMETYLSTLELRYGDLRRELQARQLNLEQYPNLIWITKSPVEGRVKDRPKRSIIVLLSVLATFVFASLIAVVLDKKD